jgi:hypothetical protein
MPELVIMRRKRKTQPATWETVRKIALALPDAVEGTSYGTPAFHVRKKLFVRFHQSGESVVIMIHMNEREALMKIDPETFYITNHYLNYPAMLVRLSTVQPEDLRKLITESWRRSAPNELVAAYDGRP